MLNKRIILFKIINTSHSGKNIATLINDEIIDLGIRDKLFHVRCCEHILNLIVKYGLKQVDSTLEKIRDIAYNINCSQAKHELFFYCCKIANMKRKNISFYTN